MSAQVEEGATVPATDTAADAPESLEVVERREVGEVRGIPGPRSSDGVETVGPDTVGAGTVDGAGPSGTVGTVPDEPEEPAAPVLGEDVEARTFDEPYGEEPEVPAFGEAPGLPGEASSSGEPGGEAPRLGGAAPFPEAPLVPPLPGPEVDSLIERDAPGEISGGSLRVDFGAHLEAHYPRLVGQLFAITLDSGAAHDLVQEAYSRAWRRWSEIRTGDAEAWVRRVAVRASMSPWRRLLVTLGLRNSALLQQESLDPRTAALLRTMSRLPLAERRAAVLVHMAGLGVGEVARLERVSSGTVLARLSRGDRVLGRFLTDGDGVAGGYDRRGYGGPDERAEYPGYLADDSGLLPPAAPGAPDGAVHGTMDGRADSAAAGTVEGAADHAVDRRRVYDTRDAVDSTVDETLDDRSSDTDDEEYR